MLLLALTLMRLLLMVRNTFVVDIASVGGAPAAVAVTVAVAVAASVDADVDDVAIYIW